MFKRVERALGEHPAAGGGGQMAGAPRAAPEPSSGDGNTRAEQELWAEQELTFMLQDAGHGDASACRRAAELLELLGRDEEAAAWWQRAAREGDPDAICYVREVF